ncbi:hypothetical protein ONZ45_g1959 [Pleurotus djamor]|nr:hypothetical protein ONZ45_g1959 [Pleurotus djamor]
MTVSPKTKALLIGICDDGSENPLLGPQKDVRRMRKLLIETYGYKTENIVVMHDQRKKSWLQPTKRNILREIDDLVKDCQPGDRFVFHYSGHTGQQRNLNGTEADGKDERIEVMNGEYILDDDLRRLLVDRLCPGSQLVAIFDSCHSATLLDLPHVDCHDTLSYHSSIMNGTEFSSVELLKHSPGPGAFRSRGRLPASSNLNMRPKLTLQLPTKPPIAFPAGGPATSILAPADYSFSPVSTLETSPVTVTPPDRRNNLIRNAAIDDKGEFYHGACLTCPILQRDKVQRRNADLPMVLAISACTDAQRSYEDSKGNGMTWILCNFLKEFPNPSLNRLHTRISFGLFKPSWTRVHSRKWLEFVTSLKEQGDEANYYQHPSLSSLQRLNLNHQLRL